MLVHQLDMRIAAQKDREVIEPRNNPGQLYAVHQKDRHGNLVLADMVQEYVLNILTVGYGLFCLPASRPSRSIVPGLGFCMVFLWFSSVHRLYPAFSAVALFPTSEKSPTNSAEQPERLTQQKYAPIHP